MKLTKCRPNRPSGNYLRGNKKIKNRWDVLLSRNYVNAGEARGEPLKNVL